MDEDFERWRKSWPPGQTDHGMASPRVVFQRFTMVYIDLPALWSRDDQARAEAEGWAIGNMVHLDRSKKPRPIEATTCIGRVWGTFVSDADAHAWVAEQARGAAGPYRRALAVVAAITIRQGG